MSDKPNKARLNALILEEAADWFVEFEGDEGDPAQRQAFDEWLRRSPEHVKAFLELLPIWEHGAATDLSVNRDPEQLIALALRAGTNVVVLNSPRTREAVVAASPLMPVAPRLEFPSTGTRLFAVAACAALAVLGFWFYSHHNTYTTDIGEQRSLTLADGSLIELNARSQVRVLFNEEARTVHLLQGQALFKVAPEMRRPFIVRSADTDIRALGTQFDVNRKRFETTVTVLEGRVAVSPTSRASFPVASPGNAESPKQSGERLSTNTAVVLGAGEQVSVTPTARPTRSRANVAAATAWTQRRLMFQKNTLAEVAEEFNRYNTRPLYIDDPRIQGFLVSGTFSSTDPASLLRFLREQPGIRVTETDSAVRVDPIP